MVLTIQFFLHCSLHSNERRTPLSSLIIIYRNLLDNTKFSLTQTSLFGNTDFNTKANTKIINLTIDIVFPTKRFSGTLLSTVVFFFFCLLPHTRRVQDYGSINDYLAAGNHQILPHWVLFLMSWKSMIRHHCWFCGRFF